MLLIVALVFGGMVLFYFTGPIGVAVAVGAYFLWAWFSGSDAGSGTSTSSTSTKPATTTTSSSSNVSPHVQRAIDEFLDAVAAARKDERQAAVERANAAAEELIDIYVNSFYPNSSNKRQDGIDRSAVIDVAVDPGWYYMGSKYPHGALDDVMYEAPMPW